MKGSARYVHLGGHGFPVLSPMGNWPISKVSAASYPVIVHETASGEKIKESGFISSMDRFGVVNFTIGSRGGYQNQANCLVKFKQKLGFGHFPRLGIFLRTGSPASFLVTEDGRLVWNNS